jgi:hypothetical protein
MLAFGHTPLPIADGLGEFGRLGIVSD